MKSTRTVAYVCVAIGILLLATYGVLLFTPFNTGPPRTGNRLILAALDRLGYGFLGMGLLAFYSLHPSWLADNYEPGMKVRVFTTRRVTAIAAVAAVVAAVEFIRLPFGPSGIAPDPVVGSYAMIFLGGFEGFFGNLFGSYLYTLMAGSPGGDPLIMVLLSPLSNSSAYVAFAYIYRWLDISKKKPIDRAKNYVLFYLVAMACFLVGYWSGLPGYFGWELTVPLGVLGTIGGSVMIALAFAVTIGTLEATKFSRRRNPPQEHPA